jgi:hypothetical protein
MGVRAKIYSFITDSILFGAGLSSARVRLKNNASVLEARNAADAAFVIGRGADPVGNDDWVTLRYLRAQTSYFEVDFGAEWLTSGTFDITGLSGLTPGQYVFIQQAPGPYTGKPDPDEAELSPLWVTAYVYDATTIRCYWAAIEGFVNGYFIFMYRTN